MQICNLTWQKILQSLTQTNQKSLLQVHHYLRNLIQGISIADPLPYLPYYAHTYVPYGFVPRVLVIYVCSDTYSRIYHGIVRGCDSVHACTFSRNMHAHAYAHARNINRNLRTSASKIICARASVSILAHTSSCLCVCEQASVSIFARVPTSIHAHSGCSACLYIILSNNKESFRYLTDIFRKETPQTVPLRVPAEEVYQEKLQMVNQEGNQTKNQYQLKCSFTHA